MGRIKGMGECDSGTMGDGILRLHTSTIQETATEDLGASHSRDVLCRVFVLAGCASGTSGGLESRAVDVGVCEGCMVGWGGGCEKVFRGMEYGEGC